MKHHEHDAAHGPEPVGLAKKLFLYTVAGAILWGLAIAIQIFVR